MGLMSLISLMGLTGCDETVSDAKQETVLPQIYPDYLGVTIPVNIAPLCFCMDDEAALRVDAVITDRHGNSLHSQGKESVDFDLDEIGKHIKPDDHTLSFRRSHR